MRFHWQHNVILWATSWPPWSLMIHTRGRYRSHHTIWCNGHTMRPWPVTIFVLILTIHTMGPHGSRYITSLATPLELMSHIMEPHFIELKVQHGISWVSPSGFMGYRMRPHGPHNMTSLAAQCGIMGHTLWHRVPHTIITHGRIIWPWASKGSINITIGPQVHTLEPHGSHQGPHGPELSLSTPNTVAENKFTNFLRFQWIKITICIKTTF
jgi:hypothetical protein